MGNTTTIGDASEFQSLWSAHQEVALLSVEQVGDYLGGKVEMNIDAGIFTNACAIRLSHAFNEATDGNLPKIPYIEGAVSSDVEQDWHLFRVNDTRTFMESNFGPPNIVSDDPADFYGQQGVIAFQVDQWSDATGHVDLFDGAECGTGCYWAEASQIEMWTFDKPEAVNLVTDSDISYGSAVELSPEDFPTYGYSESGIPVYNIEDGGHFAPDSLGNVFANSFSEETVSIRPVYDSHNNLFSFYISEQPDGSTGFYIQPGDLSPHLQDVSEFSLEQDSTLDVDIQLPDLDIEPNEDINSGVSDYSTGETLRPIGLSP